jgi:lysophospholipase L1-like esterase
LTAIVFALLLLQVRIVTFGDSLTAPRAGVVTYSDVLARTLPEQGIEAEVINSGLPGNTSTQARARFAADVLEKHPGLVIIQLGANDAAIDVWKDPPAAEPRVGIETYRGNLEYFIRALRERNSKIILMTPNRFAWTPRLRSLYGKPPYRVTSDDGFNFMLDKYSGVVRDIARREKIDLIDAANAVPASALLDGMHPNSDGHRIVGELLLPVVRALLRTR